jgi:cytochrome c-type biogenesis protein CcmE
MSLKPKHKRLVNIIVLLVFISFGAFALAKTFKENLIYFYSPSDLENLKISEPKKLEKLSKKKLRIGGLVKEGSVQKIDALNTNFIITDEKFDIKVSYNGILPPLFRDLQGMVAEGNLSLENNNYNFSATNLLTKHDENYMPPEVADSLKQKIHEANK